MRIWFISDTHGRHRELTVPDGLDMVVHCGDESNSRDAHRNANEALDFFQWYDALPVPVKLHTPGNHSTAMAAGMIDTGLFPTVTSIAHGPVGAWFLSPWTPAFNNWAYGLARHKMSAAWDVVTEVTKVLVTHGPPRYILDATDDGQNVGCAALAKAVKRIHPRIHAFGHVHDGRHVRNHGAIDHNGTLFLNCAMTDHGHDLINGGIVATTTEDLLGPISLTFL